MDNAILEIVGLSKEQIEKAQDLYQSMFRENLYSLTWSDFQRTIAEVVSKDIADKQFELFMNGSGEPSTVIGVGPMPNYPKGSNQKIYDGDEFRNTPTPGRIAKEMEISESIMKSAKEICSSTEGISRADWAKMLPPTQEKPNNSGPNAT